MLTNFSYLQRNKCVCVHPCTPTCSYIQGDTFKECLSLNLSKIMTSGISVLRRLPGESVKLSVLIRKAVTSNLQYFESSSNKNRSVATMLIYGDHFTVFCLYVTWRAVRRYPVTYLGRDVTIHSYKCR